MSKETKLKQAEDDMRLAYIDWKDNEGSDYFYGLFDNARKYFLKLKGK